MVPSHHGSAQGVLGLAYCFSVAKFVLGRLRLCKVVPDCPWLRSPQNRCRSSQVVPSLSTSFHVANQLLLADDSGCATASSPPLIF